MVIEDNTSPKKLIILRILEILEKYSDGDHKLKHSEILRILKREYGIECERKAIARNISILDNAGYEIRSESSGVYLVERKFDTSEIRYLIDSVLFNQYIPSNQAKDLIDKLKLEGGISFKNFKTNIKSFENENLSGQSYFPNIDFLSLAIEKGVKVEFYYLAYKTDKRLYNKSDKKNVVNPYQLLFKNGKYYLMCNYDQHPDSITFNRIDKISGLRLLESEKVKPLNQISGFENDFDISKLSAKLPYLFYSTPEKIEFIAERFLTDEIIDRFGINEVSFVEYDEKNIKVSLEASPAAFRFFARQFGTSLKVISPITLVDIIKKDIDEMRKKYE
ncbi:MAG: hypothetical protein BWX72_01832 [Firmicutes bacterium ADurb.Bin080]|nr:MAG: hypothetical protein BWX72_01832 [Firmicutes bacterium ADurb.Bin080]